MWSFLKKILKLPNTIILDNYTLMEENEVLIRENLDLLEENQQLLEENSQLKQDYYNLLNVLNEVLENVKYKKELGNDAFKSQKNLKSRKKKKDF